MNTRLARAVLAMVIAAPALATVAGHSTVSYCGEAGNWIDITFTSDEPVTLDIARWDFQATNVWARPERILGLPHVQRGRGYRGARADRRRWPADPDDLGTEAPYRLWFTYDATAASDVPPTATRLLAATPNPFNPRTMIAYELEADMPCRLTVHDLRGRVVRTLVQGQ